MICDSGATSHLIGQEDILENKHPVTNTLVMMGDGRKIKAKSTGTIKLISDDGNTIAISNVLYVPGLREGLFSVGKACDSEGIHVEFGADECRVTRDGTTLLRGHRRDRHYRFTIPTAIKHTAYIATSLETWHHRLGHIHYQAIEHMNKGKLVDGLTIISGSDTPNCRSCALHKGTKRPKPKESTTKASTIGYRIHTDIAGPFPESATGNRYYVSFIDEKSRMAWIYF